MTDTVSPLSNTTSLGRRCALATLGVVVGLFVGGVIWAYNWLTGHDHEVLFTTLVLMMILGGTGFFVPARKTGWVDAILYFLLLGFLDN